MAVMTEPCMYHINWPLHNIAITNIVWYIAYKRKSEEARTLHSSRAILLQQCEPYRWEGQQNDDWLVHKSVEVNEYLVKANICNVLIII